MSNRKYVVTVVAFAIVGLASLAFVSRETIIANLTPVAYIESPTPTTVKQHEGRRITVRGKYSLYKAGHVVETPQLTFLIDRGYGKLHYPEFDTLIEVTGTLETSEDVFHPVPHALKDASFIEVQSSSIR